MDAGRTKLICSRIRKGQKYWKKENKTKFEKFRNYLKIKHYDDSKELTDRISVPLIHSIVRTKCPAIYLRNPKYLVKIKPKINPEALQESLKNLPTMQAAMGYLPDEIGMKREMKRGRIDLVGFGKVVMKVGFEFELEDEKVEEKTILQQGIEKVKQFVGMEIEKVEEEEPKVLVDRFFVKRVGYPNGDFVIDPESTDGLNGARWCAEKVVRPLEDVKADKYLENTSDLESNVKIKDELKDDKDEVSEDRLEYYYYWEKNRYGVCDKMYIVVPSLNKCLKETKNPYKHGDWPYEEGDNYIIPDYLFPVGDIQPIISQQEEIDQAESIMMTHMRSFKQKYKTTKNNLDSKAKTALQSTDHTVIECKNPNELVPLENPALNQTTPLSIQTAKDDMNRISGITDFMQAAMPTGQRTLGEGQLAESGARQRGDEALQEMEDLLTRIGRKLMQVVQQYATEEMLLLISGEGKRADDWNNFSPERMSGEFELSTEPFSTAPIDKERLANKALALYNAFKQDPDVPIEAKAELRKSIAMVFDDVISDPLTFSKIPPPVVPPGMGMGTPAGVPKVMDEAGNVMTAEEADMVNEGAVKIPEGDPNVQQA